MTTPKLPEAVRIEIEKAAELFASDSPTWSLLRAYIYGAEHGYSLGHENGKRDGIQAAIELMRNSGSFVRYRMAVETEEHFAAELAAKGVDQTTDCGEKK